MRFESCLRRRLVRLHAALALYVSALTVLNIFVCSFAAASEMAVVNVTRNDDGDLFSITGTDCGPTRCMEASAGTALQGLAGLTALAGSLGESCVCQCRHSMPTYREDRGACVDDIEECPMASYGNSELISDKIPFVFLPMKGQIIYPSKEIKFTDSSASVCAVTGAQYLTTSGLVVLRDSVDQDVPFGLFRDEGKTFLMWLGSVSLRTRLSGRVVVAHVVCGAPDVVDVTAQVAQVTPHCAAFRLPGSPDTDVTDVSSILFSDGPPSAATSAGLSLSESLAVAACAFILAAVYAASVVFFVHLRRRKGASVVADKYDTNGNTMAISDVEKALSANMKTNPLHQLRMDTYHSPSQSADCPVQHSDLDLSNFNNNEPCNDSKKRIDHEVTKESKKSHIISAMVHSALRKSGSRKILPKHEDTAPVSEARIETLPEVGVSIIDDDLAFDCDSRVIPPSAGHGRRKLYFNPAFFETRLLKNPPPAAVEFLIKIREVMAIAKEKMLSKRFIPTLIAIQEELPCHLLDLGWEIGSYFNSPLTGTISLKRDNSRKKYNCEGCPGCDSISFTESHNNSISNKALCQSCVSEEFKQKIVRKWLDNVPIEPATNIDTLKQVHKSIAKVEGTPRSIEPIKYKDNENLNKIIKDTALGPETPNKKNVCIVVSKQDYNIRVRQTMPPPPPPPTMLIYDSHFNYSDELENDFDDLVDTKDANKEVAIPVEVKEKMKAVIDELSEITKVEPPCIIKSLEKKDVISTLKVNPVQPRIIAPLVVKMSKYRSSSPCPSLNSPKEYNDYEADSLERNHTKRRASFTTVELSHRPYDRFQSNRMSFIAMEQLEPLKKIQDMNSRLSRSYQGFDELNNIIDNKFGSKLEKCTFSSYTNLSINREGKQDSLVNEVYVNNFSSTTSTMTESSDYSNLSFRTRIKYSEPITKPGKLTIEVADITSNNIRDEDENFDPDTLDRKTVKTKTLISNMNTAQRRGANPTKPVEKILLKSSGSFKSKNIFNETETCIRVVTTENTFDRKIGSLREIYQAKSRCTKSDDIDLCNGSDFIQNTVHRSPSIVTCILKQQDSNKNGESDIPVYTSSQSHKSPVYSNKTYNKYHVIQNRRKTDDEITISDHSEYYNGNVDNYSNKSFYLNRPYQNGFQNTDFGNDLSKFKKQEKRMVSGRCKKLESKIQHRTEDSGYLSTDSNESKHKSKFMLEIADKIQQMHQVDDSISDTDDFESLCDGHSESGAESVETNSVFFGNFRKTPSQNGDRMKEFEKPDNVVISNGGSHKFNGKSVVYSPNQIDSGFQGEIIIHSSESDSEHKSVISISMR